MTEGTLAQAMDLGRQWKNRAHYAADVLDNLLVWAKDMLSQERHYGSTSKNTIVWNTVVNRLEQAVEAADWPGRKGE